jgi:hypothetical protein
VLRPPLVNTGKKVLASRQRRELYLGGFFLAVQATVSPVTNSLVRRAGVELAANQDVLGTDGVIAPRDLASSLETLAS